MRATNENVRNWEGVQTFEYGPRKYEVSWAFVLLWDEPDHADWLARELGTYAKHAPNKFPQDRKWWETISVVALPST